MARKMSKKMLNEKVCMLKELEAMVSELSIQIESLKDEIKAEMTKQDTSELVGDTWKVTWNSYETSRFNQRGFQADNPELFEAYKVSSTQRRFTVK